MIIFDYENWLERNQLRIYLMSDQRLHDPRESIAYALALLEHIDKYQKAQEEVITAYQTEVSNLEDKLAKIQEIIEE
jgi:hypothetical protein